MSIVIRPENSSDHSSILRVTQSAFEGRPYADGDEQDLIDSLRAQGALVISLVAVDDDQLVGQISFSPATISSGTGSWYALGPVAVSPERQKQGIGAALIEAGLAELRQLGASGCILTGDPAYYSMRGFSLAPEHCPEAESPEYFMLYLLDDSEPDGQFAFHKAFYSDANEH